MSSLTVRSLAPAFGAVSLVAAVAAASPAAAGDQDSHAASLAAHTVLSGRSLTHRVNGTDRPLSGPDDLVHAGRRMFVAFQNGIGSTGTPASDGTAASTLVEFTPAGRVLGQWDLTGKIDGLGADPTTGTVAATVNEDGTSSLYTLDPSAGALTHYAYDSLTHGGGTDAISFLDGHLLISASAPTAADGPAVYSVTLRRPASSGGTGVAHTVGLFNDNATATSANRATLGKPVTLALTDPDSNTLVPAAAPRFAGNFLLDSQGDQQQIYVAHPGAPDQHLSALALSAIVDDTAFATTGHGVLYAADPAADTVDTLTGEVRPGQAFVSVTPDIGTNSLGRLDLNTGTITPVTVTGQTVQPKGLLFLGGQDGSDNPGNSQGADTRQDEQHADSGHHDGTGNS
jgi:hypothetical protein